jgi:hypothetical protein
MAAGTRTNPCTWPAPGSRLSELQLLAAVRRSIREHGGEPSSCQVVPGIWQLLAIDHHGPRAGSPEAELASMPTPGRRTAMRRWDRTVEAIARRAPWILRGMARLGPVTGRR